MSATDLFGLDVKEHVDGRLHVVVFVVVQRLNLNETLMGNQCPCIVDKRDIVRARNDDL